MILTQRDFSGLFLQAHGEPLNTNQLAKELGLDYKAIQHHIKILEKNNLITKMGEKYGVTYFISTYLEVNMETFEEIATKLDKSK
jgi:predicted transcriptional regulator